MTLTNRDPRFPGPSIPSVTVRETRARLTTGDEPAPALIDVREAWEYAEGHAVGAVNLPLSELQARAGEVPRDRDVFLICHVGQRSMVAARFLKGQGVERVLNVEGGTDEWVAARLPIER
jgi:rhodanese-related sulfurtransferase